MRAESPSRAPKPLRHFSKAQLFWGGRGLTGTNSSVGKTFEVHAQIEFRICFIPTVSTAMHVLFLSRMLGFVLKPSQACKPRVALLRILHLLMSRAAADVGKFLNRVLCPKPTIGKCISGHTHRFALLQVPLTRLLGQILAADQETDGLWPVGGGLLSAVIDRVSDGKSCAKRQRLQIPQGET